MMPCGKCILNERRLRDKKRKENIFFEN